MSDEEMEEGEAYTSEAAYAEALGRMASLSQEELLAYANRQLLLHLIVRVDLGMASHQEMSVLKGLLNDNRMVLQSLASQGPKMLDYKTPETLPVSNKVLAIPTYEDEEE